MQVGPDLFPAGCVLNGQGFLAAGHHAFFAVIDLDDLQFHVLADELGDLFHIALGQVGGGDEGAHALDVSQKAALDGFLAHAVYQLARFILAFDFFPQLAVDDIALGENHVAFAVVDLDDLNLDLVTQFNILVHQLITFDEAIGFVADVDADLVICELHHLAHDGLSLADTGHAVSSHLHQALLPGGSGLLFLGLGFRFFSGRFFCCRRCFRFGLRLFCLDLGGGLVLSLGRFRLCFGGGLSLRFGLLGKGFRLRVRRLVLGFLILVFVEFLVVHFVNNLLK